MSADLVTERMAALIAAPREHEGVRVVTLAQVDVLHERQAGHAGRMFREHRDRLVLGEDYFLTTLEANDAEPNAGSKFTRDTVLLSETGYALLVKVFRDDVSWEVQRALVRTYFRAASVVERALSAVLAEVAQLRAEVAQERADRCAAQRDRFDAAHALRLARSNAASTLGAAVSPRLRVLGEEDPKQTNLAYRSFEELIEDRARARGDGRINSTEAAALLGCSVRALGQQVKAGKVVRRYTGARRAYAIDDVRAVLGTAVAS